jgi:DNA-directed RNA polymerase subunit RPC12/RpoP
MPTWKLPQLKIPTVTTPTDASLQRKANWSAVWGLPIGIATLIVAVITLIVQWPDSGREPPKAAQQAAAEKTEKASEPQVAQEPDKSPDDQQLAQSHIAEQTKETPAPQPEQQPIAGVKTREPAVSTDSSQPPPSNVAVKTPEPQLPFVVTAPIGSSEHEFPVAENKFEWFIRPGNEDLNMSGAPEDLNMSGAPYATVTPVPIDTPKRWQPPVATIRPAPPVQLTAEQKLQALLSQSYTVWCQKCGQPHHRTVPQMIKDDDFRCRRCGYEMHTVAKSRELQRQKGELEKITKLEKRQYR